MLSIIYFIIPSNILEKIDIDILFFCENIIFRYIFKIHKISMKFTRLSPNNKYMCLQP